MKLQELVVTDSIQQTAKVFESYFGSRFQLSAVNTKQARSMLDRVRTLVREHRRTSEFHSSEQNPSYLKLVMMEQALVKRIRENSQIPPTGQQQPTTQPSAGSAPVPADQAKAQQALMIRKIKDPKLQAAMKKSSAGQNLSPDEQQLVANAAMAGGGATMQENRRKSLRHRLREASEVQQAQVVLASKDMVDQVQKMIEQVTAIQFKDLPALVDQIKNEVGVDQATQFNADASAALGGLVQNLQGAKQQLDAALGVVTGQAPQVPGGDLGPGADVGADMGAELPPEGSEELDINADIDADADEELGNLASSLGRAKR